MLPRKEAPYEPYALEDMISSLQTRGASLDDLTSEDPVELLRQRERDLVLAAELGKALLERNQELTRQSEALAESYANKIEVSAMWICVLFMRAMMMGLEVIGFFFNIFNFFFLTRI